MPTSCRSPRDGPMEAAPVHHDLGRPRRRRPLRPIAHGYDNPWFQRALHSGQGRIQAGGIERDVAFQEPEPDAAARVTAAYHAKYNRYGP